jgi:hypothetical protein
MRPDFAREKKVDLAANDGLPLKRLSPVSHLPQWMPLIPD